MSGDNKIIMYINPNELFQIEKKFYPLLTILKVWNSYERAILSLWLIRLNHMSLLNSEFQFRVHSIGVVRSHASRY